jgi:5-methylcytosine-specific restriction protein A
MRLIDDRGRVLAAEYTVEPDEPHLAVLWESRSGRPERNPDYNRALTVLLTRLSHLDAVLVDALVDSRRTQELALPESERRLIAVPIRLASEPDIDALRRRLGATQARVGRQRYPAGPRGNPTRRIRLRLQVPGYQPGDAARLAETLARPLTSVVPMFILTWHPLHYHWVEHGYDEAIQETAAGRAWPDNWTVGVRRGGISPGDRAFLYRQHRNRGLVASGTFTSSVQDGEHWEDAGRAVRLAQLDWETVLDHKDRLSVEVLKTEIPEVKWDRIQGSGIAVPPIAAPRLADMWARHTSAVIFRSPDEPRKIGEEVFPEGALSRVEVNRYERDPRARKACLDHHGYRCIVCDFSFEDRYGPLGKSYIHVHHKLELSTVPPSYRVNPITDLVPVCPNCHAMIHRGTGPALAVEELKRQLRR